jgi:hypothetical protein
MIIRERDMAALTRESDVSRALGVAWVTLQPAAKISLENAA